MLAFIRADAQGNEDVNEAKTNLLGDYLRRHLLSNMPTKDPAKELVKRSFRSLGVMIVRRQSAIFDKSGSLSSL